MESLRPLEVEALRIVARASGKYDWYRLERILPIHEYPLENQNTVAILRRLHEVGFIKPVEGTEDRGGLGPFYAVTDAGYALLKQVA